MAELMGWVTNLKGHQHGGRIWVVGGGWWVVGGGWVGWLKGAVVVWVGLVGIWDGEWEGRQQVG